VEGTPFRVPPLSGAAGHPMVTSFVFGYLQRRVKPDRQPALKTCGLAGAAAGCGWTSVHCDRHFTPRTRIAREALLGIPNGNYTVHTARSDVKHDLSRFCCHRAAERKPKQRLRLE